MTIRAHDTARQVGRLNILVAGKQPYHRHTPPNWSVPIVVVPVAPCKYLRFGSLDLTERRQLAANRHRWDAETGVFSITPPPPMGNLTPFRWEITRILMPGIACGHQQHFASPESVAHLPFWVLANIRLMSGWCRIQGRGLHADVPGMMSVGQQCGTHTDARHRLRPVLTLPGDTTSHDHEITGAARIAGLCAV